MKILKTKYFRSVWNLLWRFIAAALFIYIVYLQLKKEFSLPVKIGIVLIAFIVLTFFIYNEYLQLSLQKILYALNINCDVVQSRELLEKMKKIDRWNGNQANYIIIESQFLLDDLKFEQCKQFLDQNLTIFRSSLEALLIYNYDKLKIAASEKNATEGKEYYLKCVQLLESKIKGKRIKQYFSLDEVNGLYNLSIQKNKEAYRLFNQTSTKGMNVREQVQLIYFKTLAAKRMKDSNKVHAGNMELTSYEGTSILLKGGNSIES